MPQNAPDPRPDNELDPGASTQMFQAYVDRHQPEQARTSWAPTALVAGIVVALVVVVAIVWLVLAR